MYGIDGMAQMIWEYAGGTAYWPAFFLCLAACFLMAGGTGRKRVIGIFLLAVLLIFNDVSLKVLGKFADSSTYYRFLWAVPLIPVISYVLTKALTGRGKAWQKALIAALAFAVLACWHSGFYREGCLRPWDNKYGISGDVVEACRLVAGDSEEENPVVVFDIEAQMSARIYDPSIRWGIGRNAYVRYNDRKGYRRVPKRYRPDKALIHAANYGIMTEPGRLRRALRKRKVDYVVTFTEFGMDSYLEGMGFTLVGRTGGRSVYGKH